MEKAHVLSMDNGIHAGPARMARNTHPRRMYLDHFGLTARPFSLLPDPDFLYWSDTHSRAFAMLEYGLATFAPITLVTGEIGAGKTTLLRQLLRTAPADLRIGLISNAHGKRGQLLHWIMRSLGEEPGGAISYVRRFSRLETVLEEQTAAGSHTLLIFDEAQNLSESMLEELRCLSNLNNESRELVQIMLVGQPELNELMARPSMLQFVQRIAARHHLTGMPRAAVADYIAHRLAVAGCVSEVFTPTAVELVAIASAGIPRVINQICDYALVYAYAEGRDVADAVLVRQVIVERKVQSMTQRVIR